jgi:uracil-DNA glycosylase
MDILSVVDQKINNDWKNIIIQYLKQYENNINKLLSEKNKIIYPPVNLIFNAFIYTPLSTIKVVIIGQDLKLFFCIK